MQFTGIFAVLLFLVLAGIYITTEKNRRIDFNDRLYDRALTVAELYLAEDNLSKEKFRDVQRKFPLFLPDEIIRIYDNAYQPVFIKQDEYQWPKEVIDRVVGHKQISYRLGSRQVVGLYYNDNSGNFVVLISANDTYGFKRMHELFIDMLFAYVLSLFIMFLLGRLFSRNALSPISKVIKDVKIIRSTSLDRRLEAKGSKDEINELVVTFNNLLEHLDQSFDAQKSFIANASHELRTPITAIIGDVEVTLAQPRTADDYTQTLNRVLNEAVKLNELIENLLEMAQTNIESGFEDIRLDELIWQVKDEWCNKVPGSDIELVYRLGPDVAKYTFPGNRHLLFIAIGNIIKNALKFSGNKKVTCTITGQAHATIISITDLGMPIPEADVKRIFDPFKRGTNSAGFPGFGIGLSLSEKIFRLHNVSVHVNTEYREGSEFVLTFPN